MTTPRSNRFHLATAAPMAMAIALFCGASPAEAKRTLAGDCLAYPIVSAPILPEHFAPSPGGVDMRSGQYLYAHKDLSIGDGNGMTLERMFSPISFNSPLYRDFGSLTHNWDIWVDEDRIQTCASNEPNKDDYQVSLNLNGRTLSFRAEFDPVSDGFVQISGGHHARLEFTYTLDGSGYRVPSQYTLYQNDGSKVVFNAPTGGIGNRTATASSLTEADGTTYTFDYDAQLRRVVSNRGYALVLDYSAVGTLGRKVITKACLLNLAVTALPAMSTGSMCPTGVLSSTYSYTSGEISSFTDQGGVAALLGSRASTLYRPGESSPYLTNTIGTGGEVTRQVFADGLRYDYSWNYSSNVDPEIMGGSATRYSGGAFSVIYKDYRPFAESAVFVATPGPAEVIDELSRKKTYSYCTTSPYCTPKLMLQATDPELNRRDYGYDDRNNINLITRVAKPGSGISNLVESRAYGCTQDVCASKPTTVTDARSNVTNYAYDTTHGGLLSEMQPAPSTGAARPLKLISWVQKYAYVKDGSGNLVQAASPVWVTASETQCQTVANSSSPVCDTSAPSRVTAYEYGANGTAHNLLPRGVVVTAGGVSRRTCRSYDSIGNRISETAARAGVTTCP